MWWFVYSCPNEEDRICVGARVRGVVLAGTGPIYLENVNPGVFWTTMRSPKHEVPPRINLVRPREYVCAWW